jgi:hypothetical protein
MVLVILTAGVILPPDQAVYPDEARSSGRYSSALDCDGTRELIPTPLPVADVLHVRGPPIVVGSCFLPPRIQPDRDGLKPLGALLSAGGFSGGSRILSVSGRDRKQGEASVSALSFLLMCNAIAFVYDHSKMWWRKNIDRRTARRRSFER